jgi:hypothetical protein
MTDPGDVSLGLAVVRHNPVGQCGQRNLSFGIGNGSGQDPSRTFNGANEYRAKSEQPGCHCGLH